MASSSPSPLPITDPPFQTYPPSQNLNLLLHHHHHHHHRPDSNFALIFVSVITSLALSCLFVSAFCYFHRRRKSAAKKEALSFSQDLNLKSAAQLIPSGYHFSHSTGAQVFTYKELEWATCNFSSANVIGHGGFGFVYKGILRDGRQVAIKHLDKEGKQGDHEFRVEVDLLSRLHSPYLLELIGYCADQDHRLLVYEYMPNGNLQEHLYNNNGSPQVLDWNTRLCIALDAARGLEYLHELNNPPVIHRDFKTSNILLDKNFNAKVSDFGLAKLGSYKVDGEVSTRVLGTHGYVAPEYVLTGHLTIKSDVYSFGVVLLELLTGRVPVDMKRPPGEGVLVSWALPRLTDKIEVETMVDPALKGQYSSKELIQVAAIAKMCVQSEADYRPIMTDVVQTLTPLVKHRRKVAYNHASKIQNH